MTNDKELDIFSIIKKYFQNIRLILFLSVVIFIFPAFFLINKSIDPNEKIKMEINNTTSYNYNIFTINSRINDLYLNLSLINYLKTVVVENIPQLIPQLDAFISENNYQNKGNIYVIDQKYITNLLNSFVLNEGNNNISFSKKDDKIFITSYGLTEDNSEDLKVITQNIENDINKFINKKINLIMKNAISVYDTNKNQIIKKLKLYYSIEERLLINEINRLKDEQKLARQLKIEYNTNFLNQKINYTSGYKVIESRINILNKRLINSSMLVIDEILQKDTIKNLILDNQIIQDLKNNNLKFFQIDNYQKIQPLNNNIKLYILLFVLFLFINFFVLLCIILYDLYKVSLNNNE